MARTPRPFKNLSDPAVSADGRDLLVQINATSGESLDLAIPFAEIGEVVHFLAASTQYAIDGAFVSDGQQKVDPMKVASSPIPMRGIGLAPGRSPEETILVVRLNCCDLAFPMRSSELASLGNDFSRIAQTLSAGRGKPN